ncbi:aspartic endopeptidase Pep1/aspergillopepsin F, partial [Saccharata proteae CBS 121410]
NPSTFSIPQVAAGKRLRNGPLSIARTYRKYRVPIPDDLAAAISRASAYFTELELQNTTLSNSNLSTRSVPAIPEDKYDSVYLSPVTVGTNNMMLDLDTGSGDLWVFSNLMPPSLTKNNRTLYAPAYPAAIYLGLTWSTVYGDGSSASGFVYQDRVIAGNRSSTGPQAAPIVAPYQAVEAALTASPLFVADSSGDGVMGLGFSSLNSVSPVPKKTFFDTIKPSLKAPLFTASLKHNAPGSWDFGFVNGSLFSGVTSGGGVVYADVDASSGWWEFNATGFAVGNAVVRTVTIDLIADTGTTLLYLPSSIVAAYYAAVPGARLNATQGGWIFPCVSPLPAFSLVIGGALQSVPGAYLNFGPSDRKGNCFGGMQENGGLEVAIMGDVFLKAVFVVFDG